MEISKQDKVFLYDYLCEFENEIKQHFGCYDFNDKKLQRFLFDHDIYIGAYNKTNRKKIIKHKYYLLFEQKKTKGKRNDVVHHLFRHVRNSVAHGHVIKSGRNKLRFDDFSKNDNKTMEGIIDQKVFQLLMEKLKSAKIKM